MGENESAVEEAAWADAGMASVAPNRAQASSSREVMFLIPWSLLVGPEVQQTPGTE